MGYIKHHAIIVVGTYGDYAKMAHTFACSIFKDKSLISDLSSPATNGTISFTIYPDGSKEGWSESDNGDKRREEFIKWLRKQSYEDVSSPLTWAELSLGSDDYECKIERNVFDNQRS